MTPLLPMIRPTRVRLYLLLLQSMFLLLYGFGVHFLSTISRMQAGLSALLATFTLLLLTIPRMYVETAWFIGLVTLTNATVLFLTFEPSTDLWMFGAVLLLVAMASYVPSVLEYSALSALIIVEYGLVLYRALRLGDDEVLALPLLLCMTLVCMILQALPTFIAF